MEQRAKERAEKRAKLHEIYDHKRKKAEDVKHDK
jgi:hypothetical protein